MGNAVSARGLLKKFGDAVAVDGIDFDVREGECFGIIGPNGAGKTTTMKMIYCATPRTSGELSVLGRDPGDCPEEIKKDLGVIPQENTLDTDFDVITNLLIHARYFGIPRDRARACAGELLEFIQLSEREKSPVDDLSSGMRRRLLIARGLMNDPRLLILDEPTVGLDPQARHLIWDKLRMLRKASVTLLLTTHYMEEAAELCDRVAVMDRGRILAIGPPGELIRTHIGEEVLELVLSSEDQERIPGDVQHHPARMEITSQKCLLYCEDCRSLVTHLTERGYRNIHRRPATLEDVFLTLTGRDLVE
ncbi:MAG: ABC transporter ATP-binding protein [Candidatus Aureabacteria bacterium]|nr:ABC transporter ATP-binding protein [Candidatus Auribacterota bacterium]